MRNILVSVDFSDCTPSLLNTARDLATTGESRVHLLHVVPDGNALLSAEASAKPARGDEDSLAPEKESQLGELADLLRTSDLEVEPLLATGIVPDRIAEAAEQVDAEYVVIGHQDPGVLERALGRSTSQSLLTRTNRKVVVVSSPGQNA